MEWERDRERKRYVQKYVRTQKYTEKNSQRTRETWMGGGGGVETKKGV